jgi:hypothetical protein
MWRRSTCAPAANLRRLGAWIHMRRSSCDGSLAKNTTGSAFIQKVAIVGFFALGAFAAITFLAQAVDRKYLCMAAAIVGAGDGQCGEQGPALPAPPPARLDDNPAAPKLAQPVQKMGLLAQQAPPLDHHTADQVCDLDGQQGATFVEAAAADEYVKYQLENDNYTIKATCNGAHGSDAHTPGLPPEGEVHIDSDKFSSPEVLLVTLAHEMAHVDYDQPIPSPSDPAVTCEQYTAAMLRNEGNSILAEFLLLYRLWNNGSASKYWAGVEAYLREKHGANFETLRTYMDELLANYTPEKEAETIDKMAQVYSTYEPGVAPGKTYVEYYMEGCAAAKGPAPA